MIQRSQLFKFALEAIKGDGDCSIPAQLWNDRKLSAFISFGWIGVFGFSLGINHLIYFHLFLRDLSIAQGYTWGLGILVVILSLIAAT